MKTSGLPVLGFWGLARRVVHVRRQAARESALGIVRAKGPPSDKWFATAERLRQEDLMFYRASLAAKRRTGTDQ